MRFLLRILRGIVVSFFFSVYGIGGRVLGFGLIPVLALLGEKSRFFMRRAVQMIYVVFVWMLEVTGMIRIKISKKDRKKISACQGCVVVANHPTLIDIVLLMSILPDSTGLAKMEAGKNFFYSRVVSSVFIPNTDVEKTLKDAKQALDDSVNLIVFPQGTRTQLNEKRKFHRGAAQMALRSKKDVVVLAIVPRIPFLGKKQLWCDVGDRTIETEIKFIRTIKTSSQDTSRAAAEKVTKNIEKSLSFLSKNEG